MTEAPHPALDASLAWFASAAAGRRPVENAVHGLRELLVSTAEFEAAPPSRLRSLEELVMAAATPVAIAASPRVPMSEVFFGHYVAAGFLRQLAQPVEQREAHELLNVRFDQVAVLANSLDTLVRRARINAAGDPHRRAHRLLVVSNMPRDGAPLQ